MKRVNEILLVVIFITTAVLAAAVGLKAYDIYDTDRRLAREQEELEIAQVFARNEEAQSRVQEMQDPAVEKRRKKEVAGFLFRLPEYGADDIIKAGDFSGNGRT